MIDLLTAEQVFDAAIRILLCQEKFLEVDFSPDRIRIHLPPKRILAVSCSMPVSKMTAILSEMEQQQLIGAEQRGGMWATSPGNRIIADLLERKYRKEAEAVLGPVVLKTLLQHLVSSVQDPPPDNLTIKIVISSSGFPEETYTGIYLPLHDFSSIHFSMTPSASPMFPIWQWFWPCSSRVKILAVTDRAFFRAFTCL